jgi:hypothetical protein
VTEIQFGEKDRQRWDLPEWVEFDPRDIATADLEDLSERFAFDMRDWPTVLFGELTLEQAGDPDAVPAPPKWQTRALVWMALRQNGRMVSWDEAGEARGTWLRFKSVGKAQSQSPDTSKPSDEPASSTTRRSRSSSATRKSK